MKGTTTTDALTLRLQGWVVTDRAEDLAASVLGSSVEACALDDVGPGWQQMVATSPDQPLGPAEVLLLWRGPTADISLVPGSAALGDPPPADAEVVIEVRAEAGQGVLADARLWHRHGAKDRPILFRRTHGRSSHAAK